jgi:hypothetical protein
MFLYNETLSEIFLFALQLKFKPNGTAIGVVCVTRRKHRAESWFFSHEIVTVRGGYGAVFAIGVKQRKKNAQSLCKDDNRTKSGK